MNYAKMIEILKWVKDNRQGGRIARVFGGSPYVCDNISRFPEYLDGSRSSRLLRDAVRNLKDDIKQAINGRFGVPEFLGHDDDCDTGIDSNYLPDVIEFRENMLDRLIARYEAEAAK